MKIAARFGSECSFCRECINKQLAEKHENNNMTRSPADPSPQPSTAGGPPVLLILGPPHFDQLHRSSTPAVKATGTASRPRLARSRTDGSAGARVGTLGRVCFKSHPLRSRASRSVWEVIRMHRWFATARKMDDTALVAWPRRLHRLLQQTRFDLGVFSPGLTTHWNRQEIWTEVTNRNRATLRREGNAIRRFDTLSRLDPAISHRFDTLF
jgi:hypothetical protein